MDIEEELLTHLDAVVSEGDTKARNIEVITYFLGFGENPWPTLEATGERFGIGTRERVRQIVAKNFRQRVGPGDLSSLRRCADLVASNDGWVASDLRERMIAEGWVSQATDLRAVLNAMQEIGLCLGYDLYDGRVDALTRLSPGTQDDALVLSQGMATALRKAVMGARRLPGMIGLADIDYIQFGEAPKELVLTAIAMDPDIWIGRVGDRTWYVYEDRENTLVNGAAKVFSIAERVSVNRLCNSLARHLRRRSHELGYPDEAEIESYIRGSRFFDCDETHARFLGDPAPLTDIDQSVVSYLLGVDGASWVEIRDHLLSLGYGLPLIQKAVGNSPLVHVDKGSGRPIRYTLVTIDMAATAEPSSPEDERYRRFTERLRRIEKVGTDAPVEASMRREQSILSQWLFEGRMTRRCAICGEEYGTSSLVTAHKKKRSICNERERLDPYVVMPLCQFGCDYAYERGLVDIKGGTVVANRDKPIAPGERAALDRVHGRKLEAEWLLGDPSYFTRG